MPEQPNITWDTLRSILGEVAAVRSEWAGLPTLVPGERLITEPKFPYHFDTKESCDGDNPDSYRDFINSWRCDAKGVQVYVERMPNGKSQAWIDADVHRAGSLLSLLNICTKAWSVETETRAMMKLLEMVGEHKFAQYVLTGAFLETSKRSGVTYFFRKLRPTLALRPNADGSDMRILCGLCLHSVGYYRGSWAGCLCPTDDVISHLALMRGDEKLFWKRAEQHPAHHPGCGLI